MRALWKSSQGTLQFRELDEPHIKEADDVKIRISCCTIASESLRMKREGDVFSQVGIAGYEMVGVITELGEQAIREGFAVGQRVSGTPVLFCETCEYCRQNMQRHCVSLKIKGGTLCEYVVWKSRQLIHVADHVSDKMACLIEPVATAIECVETLHPRIGCSICILGADFGGLVLLQLLQNKRIANLTVVDALPQRRELAKKFGADHVLDPTLPNCTVELFKLTNFNGFDIIIDASGDPEMLSFATKLIAKGGTFLLTSYYEYGRMVAINSMNLILHNITVKGSYLYNRDKLSLAGRLLPQLQLEELVPREYAYSDAIIAYEEKLLHQYPRVLVHVNDKKA